MSMTSPRRRRKLKRQASVYGEIFLPLHFFPGSSARMQCGASARSNNMRATRNTAFFRMMRESSANETCPDCWGRDADRPAQAKALRSG